MKGAQTPDNRTEVKPILDLITQTNHTHAHLQ